MDGVTMFRSKNSIPTMYESVLIFAGQPEHEPADGDYKNLHFYNIESK